MDTDTDTTLRLLRSLLAPNISVRKLPKYPDEAICFPLPPFLSIPRPRIIGTQKPGRSCGRTFPPKSSMKPFSLDFPRHQKTTLLHPTTNCLQSPHMHASLAETCTHSSKMEGFHFLIRKASTTRASSQTANRQSRSNRPPRPPVQACPSVFILVTCLL